MHRLLFVRSYHQRQALFSLEDNIRHLQRLPRCVCSLNNHFGGGNKKRLFGTYDDARGSDRFERKKKERMKGCPFKTLNVSKNADYKAVKASFLKIAMSHHPDTNEATCEKELEKSRDIFINARTAFESIVESHDGSAMLKEEHDVQDNFDNWFKNQTGHETPYQFMSLETMKEVAEMEENVGHGLDRDGGMWTLAAMVSKVVKDGGSSESLLSLEAGEVKDKNKSIDGVLRRKRKPRAY